MPLVTISLSKAWSIEDQMLIADGIHEAIVGSVFQKLTGFKRFTIPSKLKTISDQQQS
ncbi:MAG: hypothetical protein PVH85_02570 [Desulfobacterales bacterium]|jgi:hypothetical protein